ncbi:MAG: hypothetical protein ACOYL1_04230 [Chlamydiia bacterium]
MFQSIAKKSILGAALPLLFLISCSERVALNEPSREEKIVYVQSLKERILRAETALIRLKFDKEKLNSRFAKISKAEFADRVMKLNQEIDDLLKELSYLRSLNLDDLYDYP